MNKTFEYDKTYQIEEGRKYWAINQYHDFYFIAKEKKMDQAVPIHEDTVLPAWPFKYYFKTNDFGSTVGYDLEGKELRIILCRSPKEINKMRKQFKKEYPQVYNIGSYVDIEELGPPFTNRESLYAGLDAKGNKCRETFSEMFGCQTMGMDGPYPWDVEAVLVRMFTGKLTGTQLLWD